ncbi:unnamed protein product [Dovyalis caffra]|uniref:Uncharacterized protein n=1 Tax=Dovyalis caffra TaxID=77055 RepID=A0AAV1R1Y8_9ROSI|nr:unnamed protein product [Dovyalis caffra]
MHYDCAIFLSTAQRITPECDQMQNTNPDVMGMPILYVNFNRKVRLEGQEHAQMLCHGRGCLSPPMDSQNLSASSSS